MKQTGVARALRAIRRAFDEFLLVPACLIAGFLLLAAITYTLDRGGAAWLEPGRRLLQAHVFADRQSTADLLGVVAAALITVTSITITLLLIALQQSASALTHQIYDQFLRRRYNQMYFGFFVGLSLYALLTLATVGPVHPVYGAAITYALTIVALALLIVMFYTTIDQMRPSAIIEAIHDHVLLAREARSALLRATRRRPRCAAPLREPCRTAHHGFVSRIDVSAIDAAGRRAGREVEVELEVTIGQFVAFGDLLAHVRAHSEGDARSMCQALEAAVERSRDRDLRIDPLDGIEEMETIAWTTISTAQSDPDPALIAVCALRDLLARWPHQEDEEELASAAPVVYRDEVPARLMDAFESLAVSASESMQHQTYAEILHALATLLPRLPRRQRARAEEIILCSLSGLGDHVLTAGLRRALDQAAAALEAAGRGESAAAVEAATARLARSFGRLGSRATRAS